MKLLGMMSKLPMPPTVNSSYINVGRRRVSSPSLRRFKKEMMLWAVINRDELVQVRTSLRPDEKICLKFNFAFQHRSLYRKKDGLAKKIDVSNRIKPAEDGVCELLGFDDRWVFRVEAEKVDIGEKCEYFDVYCYVM